MDLVKALLQKALGDLEVFVLDQVKLADVAANDVLVVAQHADGGMALVDE